MSIRLKSSMQTLQYGSEEIMNLTDKTKGIKISSGYSKFSSRRELK